MERFMMEKLIQWKKSDYRKPVILEGVCQAGKTWLVKEFAKKAYENHMLYIDLGIIDDRIRKLFETKHTAAQLFPGLELIFEETIDIKNTLVVFDEVQKMPGVLKNIGELYDIIPECHVICISSQIDIVLCAEFPLLMDKVEIWKLYPMSFQEFFLATQKDGNFKKFFMTSNFDMMDISAKDYLEVLKQYYFVGGMPEAVLCFSETRDLGAVRRIHENILNHYRQFFSQYAFGAFCSRINKVWESIPFQLAKENKKFMYGYMKEGGRAKIYEEAVTWLGRYGFIHKVNRVIQPEIPFKECEDMKAYKLFLVDIGLLGCMFDLSQNMLYGDKLFDEFGGTLTEQYILQQMKVFPDWNIHYYTNKRSACEIGFLIDNGRCIVPVDVRLKVSSKDKRLRMYQKKFNPKKVVQLSMTDYDKEEQILHLPLYAAEKMIAELDV